MIAIVMNELSFGINQRPAHIMVLDIYGSGRWIATIFATVLGRAYWNASANGAEGGFYKISNGRWVKRWKKAAP
jgi:hypothetical protein